MTTAKLIAIAALAVLATPAAAEATFTCDGGAFVTYLSGPREMRVSVPGTDGWAIAMPYAGRRDGVALWSPFVSRAFTEPRKAPYVQGTLDPATRQPVSASFDIGSGVVRCARAK